MKKFPHYKQADSQDCGPTCLKIVAKHYGRLIDIQKLREISETTREGSNLLFLSDASEKICFFLLFLSVNISYAQNPFVRNVVTPLQEYDILFEKVFVDTNKSTYFLDDLIWFKAYVGNRFNVPSNLTTRLHVNLLKANGERVISKNIFINEGTGRGQFVLNNSVKQGKYYVQAYTNYMRNFGADNYFLQEVVIVGHRRTKSKLEKIFYKFEIFPEGGSLLEGTENVMGIQLLGSRKNIDFSGKVVDSKGREIANFQSQFMGMAKCSIFYEPGEKYKAFIHIKDTLIQVEIPVAKRKGVIFSLDNSKADTLSLSLHTNKSTFSEMENINYSLLYHQRNKIIGFLKISKWDSLIAQIKSDKNIFYEGVNTVTLFKGRQPVASRQFFVEKENHGVGVSLQLVNTTKDSLTYKLQLEMDNTPIKANLSISVLSSKGAGMRGKHTIESAFLLAPYFNGYLKNPFAYFDGMKDGKQLDLLLLNQNEPQNSLKKMIKNLNPRPTFNFELGFTLAGEVEPPFFSNQLALISNNDELIQKVFLTGNKKFVFERLFLYEGDTVQVAFLSKEGEAIKPKGILFDSIGDKSYPAFAVPFKYMEEYEKQSMVETKIVGVSSNAIKLEEVLLVGKKRSKREQWRAALIAKYKPLVWDIGKYFELPLPAHYKYFNNDLMSFLKFDQHVRLENWKNREYYLALPGRKEALVYINGEPVKNLGLLGLSSIEMEDVENIMIQPIKGNRIFQVFTTENHRNNIEKLAVERVVKNGYDRAKRYRTSRNNYNETQHKPI